MAAAETRPPDMSSPSRSPDNRCSCRSRDGRFRVRPGRPCRGGSGGSGGSGRFGLAVTALVAAAVAMAAAPGPVDAIATCSVCNCQVPSMTCARPPLEALSDTGWKERMSKHALLADVKPTPEVLSVKDVSSLQRLEAGKLTTAGDSSGPRQLSVFGVYIGGNPSLSDIQPGALGGLESARAIFIGDNSKLETIRPGVITHSFTQLQFLEVRGNGALTSIGIDGVCLPNLTELYLTDNPSLRALSQALLLYKPKLSIVDLTRSGLISIDHCALYPFLSLPLGRGAPPKTLVGSAGMCACYAERYPIASMWYPRGVTLLTSITTCSTGCPPTFAKILSGTFCPHADEVAQLGKDCSALITAPADDTATGRVRQTVVLVLTIAIAVLMVGLAVLIPCGLCRRQRDAAAKKLKDEESKRRRALGTQRRASGTQRRVSGKRRKTSTTAAAAAGTAAAAAGAAADQMGPRAFEAAAMQMAAGIGPSPIWPGAGPPIPMVVPNWAGAMQPPIGMSGGFDPSIMFGGAAIPPGSYRPGASQQWMPGIPIQPGVDPAAARRASQLLAGAASDWGAPGDLDRKAQSKSGLGRTSGSSIGGGSSSLTSLGSRRSVQWDNDVAEINENTMTAMKLNRMRRKNARKKAKQVKGKGSSASLASSGLSGGGSSTSLGSSGSNGRKKKKRSHKERRKEGEETAQA